MPFDAGAIRASNPLSRVIGTYVKLTQISGEFKGLCPFHGERSPSFTVNDDKGFYHCFGCGAHGDVIRFIMDHLGSGFVEACEILGGERAAPDAPRYVAAPLDAKSVYDDLMAAKPPEMPRALQSLRLWNPKAARWASFIPASVYDYGDGLAVVRIDKRDGGKETPQIRYAAALGPQGEPGWARWPFDKPRPLYGLEMLDPDVEAQILIVEGEKTADALRRLMLGWCVLTWPGGTQGARHCDWAALAGRKLVLIPDADRKMLKDGSGVAPYAEQPGPAVMFEIAGILNTLGCQVKIIDVGIDQTRADGWDMADAETEGWTSDAVLDWLIQRARIWVEQVSGINDEPPVSEYDGPDEAAEIINKISLEINQENTEKAPEPSKNGRKKKSDDEDPLPPAVPMTENEPFRILGYNRGEYYYLPRGAAQVVGLTPSNHSRANLYQLVTDQFYWGVRFPSRSAAFNLDHAQCALLEIGQALGVFDREKLRGRGAWMDAGRVIVHTGGAVYIDGEKNKPGMTAGGNIYESAAELGALIPGEIASTAEANKLVQICERLTWEDNLSGALLAGWCVIAPVCGALKWRPHIWVTGPASSGKSTVKNDIIRRVVGPFAEYFEGSTTEAGIRQSIGADARPVIIDEFESEDQTAAARVQKILDMSRISSSGGKVTKGSATGEAESFTIRSAFCFSSINTAVKYFADDTRISKLVLKRNTDDDADEHYRRISSDILSWFDDGFAKRILGRSIENLHTLLKNCDVFVTAAARVLHSRRAADQVGTMLAGLYLCYSTKTIGVDEAEKWIRKHNWVEHTAIDMADDEMRLLEKIATSKIKLMNGHGVKEMSIGSVIMNCFKDHGVNGDWEQELNSIGIKIENDGFVISNTSTPMRKILEGTPWCADWRRSLKQLTGASVCNTIYFSPGIRSKAVKLPYALLDDSIR